MRRLSIGHGKQIERLVDRQDVFRGVSKGNFELVDRDALKLAAALEPVLAPRVSTRMRRMASAAAAKK